MRNIKKLGALLLAMVMCLGLSVTAFAAEGTDYSITVNNAVAGHTYKLYKMMGLSVSADYNAYSYYVDKNGEWNEFFTTGTGAGYVDFSEKGEVTLDGATVCYVTGFKTGKDTPTEMVNFGHAAETYAAGKTAVFTATLAKAANDDAATNNVVAYTITDSKGAAVSTGNTTASDNKTYSKFTFTGLEPGYYLVVSSVGTNAIVGTTPDNNRSQVNEKNSVPTLDKTITTVNNSATDDKNNASASIGDTIGYNIHVVVPGTVVTYTDSNGELKSTGAENYVIHDMISKALTLNKDSVVVKHNDTVITATGNYTIKFDGDHCAMEIVFEEGFLNKLQADDRIDVDYTAVVNENALVGTFGNTAYLNYGGNDATGNGAAKTPDSGTGGDPNDPDPDPDPDPNDPTPKPGVHTYEIDVYKFADINNAASPLADAKFSLYRGDSKDPIAFVKISDSEKDRDMTAGKYTVENAQADRYRVATAEEIASKTAITVIPTTAKGGLIFQGLAAGNYRLSEIEAPAGYNKLDKDITITVNAVTDESGVLKAPTNRLTIDGVGTNNASVANAYGTQMPETGGIGTTLFYIIGGLLVVGAVVFLVARKRVGDDGEE